MIIQSKEELAMMYAKVMDENRKLRAALKRAHDRFGKLLEMMGEEKTVEKAPCPQEKVVDIRTGTLLF